MHGRFRRSTLLPVRLGPLLASGFFILSGCSSPAVDVHVDVVRLRDLSATVSADCLIRAHRAVRVTAGASGRVSRLAVSEGTRVTAGDLLVELAPGRLDADVQAVAAAVGAERSAVERARVAGRSARLAADRARSRSERVSALWSRGFASYEEHADAVAEVAAKQAGVRRSEAVLAQAAARLRSTEVELARVRESAREARVVAPLSGVVTRLHVAAGQQVVAGRGRYLGSSLVTIEDPDRHVVDAFVNAADVSVLAAGQHAVIAPHAQPGRLYPGRVESIGYRRRGGASYVARVVPVDAWEGVRPGFSCSTEITTASRRKVVAVPKLALLSRDGQLGVWIVRAGRISFGAVELGIDGEAYVEVLAGLRVGDRVVTGPADVARWLVPSITVRERERWVGPTARRSFSNARWAAVGSLAREGARPC